MDSCVCLPLPLFPSCLRPSSPLSFCTHVFSHAGDAVLGQARCAGHNSEKGPLLAFQKPPGLQLEKQKKGGGSFKAGAPFPTCPLTRKVCFQLSSLWGICFKISLKEGVHHLKKLKRGLKTLMPNPLTCDVSVTRRPERCWGSPRGSVSVTGLGQHPCALTTPSRPLLPSPAGAQLGLGGWPGGESAVPGRTVHVPDKGTGHRSMFCPELHT